jgi:UDP-glucuronate decarboxylase
MKVLVTGVAGNVGSALAKGLIKTGKHIVVGVDNFVTGDPKKLPPDSANFKFIKGDVNKFEDISNIFAANKFDVVFHYAALVGVKRTLDNPMMVLNDIEGIKHILILSNGSGVKRVFFSSSSEVYGEPVEFPQNEHTTPLNSRLPYAVVKNVCESFLRSYHKEYGLNYTIFRFFNTYGPSQSEDFVIPRFIKQALSNQDITIYGDGSQTRTFCYIDDNTDTTILCLEKDYCVNEVMNVGSDVEYSVRQLAEIVIRIAGSKSKIVHLPALKEGDMTRRKPDISRMKSILNRDLISIEQGLKRIIETNFSKV